MTSESPSQFLDVPRLLEQSMPKARPAWLWYSLLSVAVLVMTSTWSASQNPELQGLVRFFGGLVMLGLLAGMGWVTTRAVKQQRAEQQRIEAIEELVQLRRWDHAAALLEGMLSRPTLTMASRLQALIYLGSVLARYHRFEDAIAVHNYLLSHAQFDPGTTHGIKLMRAMAMLHEDHLVDADRAMSELRHDAPESAGLTLVEIYRDVKTGHPAEAIELFGKKLEAMRAQLGHRMGDAYAMIARAHDLLEEPSQAAASFEKATLLAPAEELYRRYPEVAAIAGKYPAAVAPREAA